MKNYQEVEIKFYVPDLQNVSKRLVALGAKLIKPRVFERNVRYENSDETLTKNFIVVRLRQDSKIRLTYKEPLEVLEEHEFSQRFEVEVEVSDFDSMNMILEKLGYRPYLVYEKYRTTYELEDTEIVLDEMPYGNFIEIEGQPQSIQGVIDMVELGNLKSYNTNYIALFDRVKHKLGLNFHDLTFANFEKIDVSEQAFDEGVD